MLDGFTLLKIAIEDIIISFATSPAIRAQVIPQEENPSGINIGHKNSPIFWNILFCFVLNWWRWICYHNPRKCYYKEHCCLSSDELYVKEFIYELLFKSGRKAAE